jgi:hypothetical protein
MIAARPRPSSIERDGVPRSVAMAVVGQKTEEVYRRYAIVDEAMIREAAIKMNRGARTRRATATAQRTAVSVISRHRFESERWLQVTRVN